MARKPDLTDCEIDRLIVEHCGASVVVFTGPDGHLAEGIDPECPPREWAIWRAAIHYMRTYHAPQE